MASGRRRREINSRANRRLFVGSPDGRCDEHRDVHTVISLRVAAPAKPDVGAPCNGCGVCCTTAPCPIGIVVSRRTTGACDALVWLDEPGLYRCGLIERPESFLPAVLRRSAPTIARIARRYVSAGSGCDCDVEASPAA